MSLNEKRRLIDPNDSILSITQQCRLLELAKSSWYYEPAPETKENLEMMYLIDKQYLVTPFYGYRRMCVHLKNLGYHVNEKRVLRLMQLMGIEAIYPRPKTSTRGQQQVKYPYLLRGVEVTHSDQVWSTDITYIPLRKGFLYLVAIMDWYSRYVITWEISNTLDEDFCIIALERALRKGKPEIFNSDQGSQFTGNSFVSVLEKAHIKISWDGKGRALDNVFIERLWRSLKYEEVYIKSYDSSLNALEGISQYLKFYNKKRPHQSLSYMTPSEIYSGADNENKLEKN